MENKVEQETESLLRCLGLSGKYHGLTYLCSAVKLVILNPDLIRLKQVTKTIYPSVAKQYHTTPSIVERNIRTLIRTIWTTCDKSELDSIAGCHVLKPPTNSEMIDILAHYIKLHLND